MAFKPFRKTAIAYAQIEEFVKTMTSVEKPLTLKQMYDQMNTVYPDCEVKNVQQINDCLKRFRQKGSVHRIREGLHHYYWWDDKNLKPLAVERAEREAAAASEQPSITAQIKELNDVIQKQKPEIVVKHNCVVITNDRIKITVEF